MANFMDKMKQSYGNAVQGIVKQSPEQGEIKRVTANMAQTEMQIQQKFTQIGQLFYMNNVNKEGVEQQYADLIEEIRKLDENRKGFYEHKLRLEGNMMCVNCGEIIPYGSVYCSQCGKRADRKEE